MKSRNYFRVFFALFISLFMSLSSYNGYKLNSLLTYSQRGFIAQLLEHCTGITEVPLGASEFFLGFLCNCFCCFITVRIIFTSKIYYLAANCMQLRMSSSGYISPRGLLGLQSSKPRMVIPCRVINQMKSGTTCTAIFLVLLILN